MIPPFETLGYAFLGGLLPALIWLYFLLKEESRCPEPWWFIMSIFIAGMVSVPFVLPLQHLVTDALPAGLPVLVGWATIEETLKYVFCAIFILWRSNVKNQVDVVMCMVTIALGFAAFENALFLIDPFSRGDILTGLANNNLRFMGATLLHVVSSSAIGFALAFSYHARAHIRVLAGSLGLILAIALHTGFNFFIINKDGTDTLPAFFLVWTAAVVFFAVFEIVKYIRYRNLPKNVC